MLDLLIEKNRRAEPLRVPTRAPAPDTADVWDFLEGAVENLDTRDRLVAEFRRASRQLLRASHAVFFLREADGFRADRGTSFFAADDPLVAFFEHHPAVIDGTNWDSPSDPVAELAVRNRLALWGAIVALLALPAVAMQFTREVNWGPGDFVAAAVLLGLTGLGLELAARAPIGRAARFFAAGLVLLALLVIWAQLAVGLLD